MFEKDFPVKFVYPDSKTLLNQLKSSGLLGRSQETDSFYMKLSEILAGCWSPIYEGMGIGESLAWEKALKESGLEPVESDLESFQHVFMTLRDEKSASSIVAHRKKTLNARNTPRG